MKNSKSCLDFCGGGLKLFKGNYRKNLLMIKFIINSKAFTARVLGKITCSGYGSCHDSKMENVISLM